MNLGQRALEAMEQIFLDHMFIFVGMMILTLFVVDYYSRFLKVVRKTDHVDLVERYVWIRLYRRYKGNR